MLLAGEIFFIKPFWAFFNVPPVFCSFVHFTLIQLELHNFLTFDISFTPLILNKPLEAANHGAKEPR